MKRVHVVSLGCPKNRVDSELMIAQMQLGGAEIVADPEEADILVVNTCAFIDSAKEESVDTILEMAQLKEHGRAQKLIVTGCLAQRYAKDLAAEMPEVDAFLGTNEFRRINDAIFGELAERSYISQGSYLYNDSDARVNSVRGGTAYVKVSEGCNRTCTFCIIPKIRGKQVSRPVEDVVAEIRRLGRAGVKESVLVAQDMTSYGVDYSDKRALARLLHALEEDAESTPWIRLLYMYPWNFTDELVSLLAAGGKLLPYVDMPLQHVSEPVLKAMRRNTTQERQRALIGKLREIPGLVLRTTFITGFPGETDADFQALYRWVEEVEFDRVGVFTYSREEDTDAADLPGQVEDHVKEERRDALMELQHAISEKKNRAYIGQTLRVLVDGVSEEHEYVMEGRHAGQAPDIDGVVYLSWDDGGDPVTPGSFVDVHIEDATAYDLMGVVLPEQPLRISDEGLRLHIPRVARP